MYIYEYFKLKFVEDVVVKELNYVKEKVCCGLY